MKSPDKKTQQEIELVRNALISKEGERRLIEYLSPSINYEAKTALNNWTKKRNITLTEKQELQALNSRWDYFYFALKKYKEKFELQEAGEEVEIYRFSEYFAWFARQGVTKYLTENHGPNPDDYWFFDKNLK